MGAAWSISGMIAIRAELGDRCEGDSPLKSGWSSLHRRLYNEDGRARIEERRMAVVERMADIFDDVDFGLQPQTPTLRSTPKDHYLIPSAGSSPAHETTVAPFPANIAGNPAISIPAGSVDGCPVGLQVIGRHHSEQQLLDIGRGWSANVRGRLSHPSSDVMSERLNM